jgi:hypothetical protein
MSLNNQVFIGDYTPASCKALQNFGVGSVHNATAYIYGIDIMDPVGVNGLRSGVGVEASGGIVYLNVTAIGNGTDTIQLVLQEQDPTSGAWSNVAATTATANTTGVIKLKLKDSINQVAATATQVVIQDKFPKTWRIGIIHSGASNFTYSLGLTLYA